MAPRKKLTKGKPSPKKKAPAKSPKRKAPAKRKTDVRAKMKEALKKRMQEDQERRESSGRGFFKADTGASFWNPEGGDHLIDIIPFVAGTNHPTVEEGEPAYSLRLRVHYGIGPSEDVSVICLAETFNQPCPICEHRVQLRNEGAEEEVWKALFPKKRGIYNIFCWDSVKEENKGVQVWDVAEWYFQKYLDSLAKGPRRPGREHTRLIPFADPDEGKSIAFTINPARSKNDFAEYIGHRFDDRDYEISDDLLDEALVLDELVHIPTYEEVHEEYWGEPYDEDGTSTEEDVEEEVVEDEHADEVEEVEEGTCPGGGEFGVDTNELEACDECPKTVWDECLATREASEEAEEAEEAEEPAPRRRIQRRR